MKKHGFTLIELMIVVLIVAVLAAVIVPLLLSRVEDAKKSEGKAIAGQIATAVRAWIAENSDQATIPINPSLTDDLGFKTLELDGKYYQQTNSSVLGVTLNDTTGQVGYIITVKSRNPSKLPDIILTCNSGNGYDPTFSDGTLSP